MGCITVRRLETGAQLIGIKMKFVSEFLIEIGTRVLLSFRPCQCVLLLYRLDIEARPQAGPGDGAREL